MISQLFEVLMFLYMIYFWRECMDAFINEYFLFFVGLTLRIIETVTLQRLHNTR